MLAPVGKYYTLLVEGIAFTSVILHNPSLLSYVQDSEELV
jgi:hypothetical protein